MEWLGRLTRRALTTHSWAKTVEHTGRRLFSSDPFGATSLAGPKRVVVTGLGLVTPLGIGVEHNWGKLLKGEVATRKLRAEDLPPTHRGCVDQLACQVVACVPQEELENCSWAPKQESRRTARFMQLAAIAAEEALRDAQWHPSAQKIKERTGVAIGSGMSATTELAEAGRLLEHGAARKISPFFVPKVLGNMAAGDISVRYGFQGPNLSQCTACAAGAHAIGDAFQMIQRGVADVMVSGGTEACIDAVSLMGFGRMRALSTKYNDNPKIASRPFDSGRDGFVMGEGAGIVVLEELQHAIQRKARIYAEIRGYGVSGDGHHITKPHPEGQGAALAMHRCLIGSNVDHKDVVYINAHATSTPIGDDVEQNAVAAVFGERATSRENPDLFVSSVKGSIGHLLGAAGAVETAFTVLSLRDKVMPVNANLQDPHPHILGGLLMGSPRKMEEGHVAAMMNSFGFGGTNASLLLASPPC